MKRPAPPITARYSPNAAAFHLERYPSTAEGLRRVRRTEMTDQRVGQ